MNTVPTPAPPRPRRPRGTLRAAWAGFLAACLGVGVAELIGGLVPSAGSPVVAVGGYVIDNVPPWAKDFAIETFGRNDKVALIVGTLVILALLGVALGAMARHRPRTAAAIVAVVASVGVLATLDQAAVGPALALWPSAVGAVAAAAAIVLLARTTQPLALAETPQADEGSAGQRPSAKAPAAEDPAPLRGPTDDIPPRRRFLVASGTTLVLAGATAGAGRVLRGRNSAAASRAEVRLPRPVRPLPPITRDVAPNPAGVTSFVTPNEDFYRIDINLLVPQVRTDSYRLRVTGLVDRELDIPWRELLRRDMQEYDITLSCVSNLVGGDLLGNARWLGFPLRDLLDEAGVRPGADQVVGRSTDGYTGGFPLEAAYDRDAIVAVGMNGEPLPLSHGFPVRLVTPGIYGYLSAVKWLTEIEVTTFDAFDCYWVRRGYARRAPIKTMSRIDTPRSLSEPRAGRVVIGGMAWAQTRGIRRVEVQVDDDDWRDADLSEALGRNTWRQWTVPWDATPGFHTLRVRATDGDGRTQTEDRAEPLPDGATGWHTIRVNVQA